jgi:hypothetical protein
MKVKDFLSDASKWAQGTSARDRFGRPCSPWSPDAVSFCVLSAISLVYPKRRDEQSKRSWEVREAIRNAILDLGWRCSDNVIGIQVWNDLPSRTFSDVRLVLEKADV